METPRYLAMYTTRAAISGGTTRDLTHQQECYQGYCKMEVESSVNTVSGSVVLLYYCTVNIEHEAVQAVVDSGSSVTILDFSTSVAIDPGLHYTEINSTHGKKSKKYCICHSHLLRFPVRCNLPIYTYDVYNMASNF